MRNNLLELIKEKESYGGNYNILARDKPDSDRKLTNMTLRELVAYQKRNNDKAAGAYQFKPDTIRMLMKNMGLKNTDKFTPALQERMGNKLLDYRGYGAYERGEIPPEEFARNIAQEWASFPVIANEQYVNPVGGAQRNLQEGRSYYKGKGTNKSLFSPKEYEDYKFLIQDNSLYVDPALFGTAVEEPMVEEPVSLEPDKELNFFEKLFRWYQL